MSAIVSAGLAVVAFLAGAIASPTTGWDVTNRLLVLEPGLGRQVLIACAEALVGLGTGLLALVLATWLAPEHTAGIVAAATAGVGVGIRRQIMAMRRTRVRVASDPVEARIMDALQSVVAYGAASRLVGVAAVLVGILVATYAPA